MVPTCFLAAAAGLAALQLMAESGRLSGQVRKKERGIEHQ